MISYDGQGLCNIDASEPTEDDVESTYYLYLQQLKAALLAWGTNAPADARGEHDCLGRHLSGYGVDVGAADAYAMEVDLPSIKAANGGYYDGLIVFMKAANTNTGASTLNVTPTGDGFPLGAKNIKSGGGSLQAGMIRAGFYYMFLFEGSNFKLINPSPWIGQVINSQFETEPNQVGGNIPAKAIPSDGTVPQNDEGEELMTITITPMSATSKLVISGCLNVRVEQDSQNTIFAIFRDDEVDAIWSGNWYALDSWLVTVASFQFVVDATAATSTTFKLRGGTDWKARVYLNKLSIPGRSSMLSVQEIAQ